MIIINSPSMMLANQTMSAVPGGAPETSALQANALVMGVIYGFIHVIGPDHLGTLMTLSAATTAHRAFKTGAAWGLGHSLGMVLVAAAFMTVHHLVPINVDTWEHYGDYVIGFSMIFCAAYFILRESVFVVEQKDGTFVAQPCACHGNPATSTQFRQRPRRERRGSDSRLPDRNDAKPSKFCSSYCKSDNSDCCSSTDEKCDASFPLVPRDPEAATDEAAQTWSRDAKGAVLGVLQGFCCPMGMVGVTFLATLSTVGAVSFLFTFLFVSALGTATVAAAWASLTSRGIGVDVSPRAVYRASCCFTMALGVLWVVANYNGFLSKLNYAEHIHDR